MKIYSLSKVLSFPLVLAAGLIILNHFVGYRSEYSILVFIPVIGLVVLYIFHGVIDYWWLERNPIPLDEKMKEWFIKYLPYYNKLTEQEKSKFENRLSLYVEGREFKTVGTSELKDIPFDLSCILASQAIILTSHQSDFLLGDMDRIYVYKHPFPSPQYQFLHTVETHIEDGMILLSTEYALPGIVNPKDFYNITLHAYAEAYAKVYPDKEYPTVNQHGWEKLENVMGLKSDFILKVMGFEHIDMLAVHIVAYFVYTKAYSEAFPIEYKALFDIFSHE